MDTQTRQARLVAATLDDPRWAAIVARDAAADGTFYYSVSTTGVYCRPSCAARRARPEHVGFHATREEAEQAGFRACKRCKPDQPQAAQSIRYAARIAAACRLIASADAPTLDELATRAAMSRFHFHRVFKQQTGLTPRQYAAALREQRLRQQLANGEAGITRAIFEAGYNAGSRLYENAHAVLGMSPGRYRAGGAQMRIRFAVGECRLGSILVAQSERGICAILLGDDPDALARDLQDRFARAELIGGDAGFEQLVARVVGFVEAPGIGLDLPLDVRGTAFQQRVWQALRAIPPGQTASYAEIARRIGAPQAVRAVGQACGANALAVAIPCHRVLRHDGALSGYRWGVERKRALLDIEASAAPRKQDAD